MCAKGMVIFRSGSIVYDSGGEKVMVGWRIFTVCMQPYRMQYFINSIDGRVREAVCCHWLSDRNRFRYSGPIAAIPGDLLPERSLILM